MKSFDKKVNFAPSPSACRQQWRWEVTVTEELESLLRTKTSVRTVAEAAVRSSEQ